MGGHDDDINGAIEEENRALAETKPKVKISLYFFTSFINVLLLLV